MPLDDPTEAFDLCDADGRPLHRQKPRAQVHRDGDWHRSVHIWVFLSRAPGFDVVLQRRSASKDTHPNKVDVSVAGHLRAGETVVDAFREAEEEIGLALAPADVSPLGVRRHESLREGWADREVQEVYYAVTARTFESLRPDPDEVAALLSVRVEDALALALGERDDVPARERGADRSAPRDVVLRRAELLLASDGYFASALSALARLLAGAEARPWSLG